jgi:starvation-inducible DNA-binding protein
MNTTVTAIGLDGQKSAGLAQQLNLLLADYQVLYMNTRGFHWNIKGEKFFELHLKFEELYNNFLLKIDEIAERILTLGHTPMHSYTEYVKHASIRELTGVTEGKACVANILESFQGIITRQRNILELSAEMNDEGSNALMSDYIREQEKLVWMYTSFLQ